MRISDWSSDVCSSDLHDRGIGDPQPLQPARLERWSYHARLVRAHATGADRVIDGVGAATDHVVERRIVIELDRMAINRRVTGTWGSSANGVQQAPAGAQKRAEERRVEKEGRSTGNTGGM